MFVFLPVERQADEWQEGTRVSWPIHLLRLEWAVLQHRVQMAFALPLARIYDVLSLKSLSAECVLSFYCTRWCSIHEPIYSGWVSLQVVALSLSYFSSFHICVCILSCCTLCVDVEEASRERGGAFWLGYRTRRKPIRGLQRKPSTRILGLPVSGDANFGRS